MDIEGADCNSAYPVGSESLAELGRITCLLGDRDERLVREKNEVSLIAKVIVEANKATSHKELFDHAMSNICRDLDFTGGVACLVNPKYQRGKIIHSINTKTDFLEKYGSLDINSEPFSKLFVDGQILIGQNLQEDAPKIFEKYGTLSYMALPLSSPCGVVGGLLFFSKENKTIPKHSQDTLVTLTRYITDALRRIWAEVNLIGERDNYKNLYNLLRMMCDNVPDMIWAKGMDKTYIFTNKSLCENLLSASNTDEPIGKTDMFFAERERSLHPDNPMWHTFGEICRDSDQITIDAGFPQQFDEFGNVKGKFLFLDVRKSPFIDTQGKLIGTVGSARDVTKERAISKDLSESENLLKTTLDSISDIIGLQLPDHTVIRYNKTGYDLLKISPSDMGKKCYEYMGWASPCENCASSRCAVSKIQEVTSKMLTLNGEDRYFECRSTPVIDDSGEVVLIIEHLRDITEHKKKEDQLVETTIDLEAHMQELKSITEELNQKVVELNSQASYLSSLFTDLPIPVYYRDVQGVYRDCNQAFCKMFGVEKGDVVGKTTSDLFPEISSFEGSKDKELLESKSEMQYMQQVKTSLGLVKELKIVKSIHLSDEGEPTGIIGCMVE